MMELTAAGAKSLPTQRTVQNGKCGSTCSEKLRRTSDRLILLTDSGTVQVTALTWVSFSARMVLLVVKITLALHLLSRVQLQLSLEFLQSLLASSLPCSEQIIIDRNILKAIANARSYLLGNQWHRILILCNWPTHSRNFPIKQISKKEWTRLKRRKRLNWDYSNKFTLTSCILCCS